ncbi:MAG: RibD family protein [Clostridia bacterium]|nr:RibD family protein [Clostridia bacterium]
MKRPYIICHMVTSADGKVTGDFLSSSACERATEIYYEINREYKRQGSGGFICGRITMEESFTGGWYPDLTRYEPTDSLESCFFDKTCGYYAIAFDPKGKLGWKSNVINDSDEGYDNAHIVEVLTSQVDKRYLSYLRDMKISYIIAGDSEIDVELALSIIDESLESEFYLLEGGSIINGSFLRADCVDELSLVQAPVTAYADSKPLFMNGTLLEFKLVDAEEVDGVLVVRYNAVGRQC